MSNGDEFDTDKGVKDDYDGVITEAYFQAGDQGDTNLVLKKLAEDGDEVEDFYRVGTDWASFDGGETIEHPSKSKIRADSQLATLVEKAMEAGANDVIRERSAANGSRGQRTARLWPGLRFHWDVDAKPYNFKDRKTGEDVVGTSYKSYPTKFLGVAEDADSGSGSGSGAPVAAPAQEQMPPDIMARLKVLAQSKPFAEWVDEALTMDWVRENLLSALSDESFYNNLRSGG
jgi:hypothetical protein